MKHFRTLSSSAKIVSKIHFAREWKHISVASQEKKKTALYKHYLKKFYDDVTSGGVSNFASKDYSGPSSYQGKNTLATSPFKKSKDFE